MPLRSDPRCLECFRRGFADFTGSGGAEVAESALALVAERLTAHPPPVAGVPGWELICRRLQTPDPFLERKRELTLALISELEGLRAGLMRAGPDSAAAALRAATWANLLDVAQGRRLPGPAELAGLLDRPLARDETGEFLDALNGASTLLILGDNAGETVLDRLFLELASPSCDVYYTVRPEPVMNDAVRADAELAGLHRVAELVETGCPAPTVMPEISGPRLRKLLERADLILSKGQGNLEGLLGTEDERLYYSFVVKCDVIADATGLPLRSGVFACSTRMHERR
jgi:hypothetical protein